ncbi:tRNA (adenosine(37)-N6)-threonylcarbamoyltransferase complex dimerization subunit type 1 TsaB [Chloroflexota bacterium]
MMVLGIDTSGNANAIGVVDGDRVLTDLVCEARSDSLKKIVTNIDSALESAGLALDDIQGFGVGLGPGSWTGIRIGVTVGKILAYSANKPVCGVPTLEALACSAGNVSAPVCTIVSAGTRDTVYAAFYHTEKGSVTRAGEYYVGDIRGLAEKVKEPVVLIGAEIQFYSKLMMQALGSPGMIIDAIEALPGGAAIALLAAARLERGEGDNALSLTPLYLKESTAKAFVNRYSGKAQTKV